MSKTVYIHIGSDKAGSSSLQYFLHANRDRLEDMGCLLIRTQSIPEAGQPFLFQDLESPEWADAVAEIDNAPAHVTKFVFTWEGIHFFNHDQLRRLHDHLGKFEVKFVYYIREQATLIQSGLLQELKNANLQGVQIPHMGPDHPLLAPDNRDYNVITSMFEEVFGPDCMQLRVFERGRMLDGDVKTDFLDQIGLERTPDFADPEDLNPSLTVEAGIATQMLDRLFGDEMQKLYLRDIMLRLSTRLKGSKNFLGKGAVKTIRDRYTDCNRAVAQKYFGQDELFELKSAHNPQRYEKHTLRQYLTEFFTIWPEFPTVKPNADLLLFQDQYGDAKEHWRVEDRVAWPTVTRPKVRFRTQIRFLLPRHNSVSLKLRAPGSHMFRCHVYHREQLLGTVSAYEKLFLPLSVLDPYDIFDLELEPTSPEDEIRLIGISWAYEEEHPPS